MGQPNERTIECIRCGVFNLDNAIIMNDDVYCLRCFAESSDLQNRLKEMIFEEKKKKE